MERIDLAQPKHLHFIGIGGISMSGIAKLFLTKGFTVTGSDWKKSQLTEELESLGAHISYGPNKASNVASGVDLLVYTSAVHTDNEELCEAQRLGIPCITRGQMMGALMQNYRRVAGVSGMHGKTTTTSMLTMVLLGTGKNPTAEIGGIVPSINTNFLIGGQDYFVAESCEYTDSFLDFWVTDAIILNIEEEHLDYFSGIEAIRSSFRKFASIPSSDGRIFVNSEIEDYRTLFADVKAELVSYGIVDTDDAQQKPDIYASDVTYDDNGFGVFNVTYRGTGLGTVRLSVPGRHNVSNALPVIGIALSYGIPFEDICRSIVTFTGTERRMEKKGVLSNGAVLYDDYAHHPSEIRTTLCSINKNKKYKRIITAFQPHTFSRTKQFLQEFADALALSDVVVLADIYPAREVDDGTISSADIQALLLKKGKEAYHFHEFSEIAKFLSEFSTEGDLLITMGAGDIVKVGESMLNQ